MQGVRAWMGGRAVRGRLLQERGSRLWERAAPFGGDPVLRQLRASGSKRRLHEGADMDREGQTTTEGRALAERLGRVGLWTRQLDLQPTQQVRATVAELEELGWGALWSWEVFGREALTNAALL